MALESYRRLFKKKDYHHELPPSAPRRRKSRCVCNTSWSWSRSAAFDETSTVEGGMKGEESANVDQISAGGCQLLRIIPSSTKRLRCASQHEYWIINGIMFVVGKRRIFCLRPLPLLLAISISLQLIIPWKITVAGVLFTLSPFCSLHLIN